MSVQLMYKRRTVRHSSRNTIRFSRGPSLPTKKLLAIKLLLIHTDLGLDRFKKEGIDKHLSSLSWQKQRWNNPLILFFTYTFRISKK